MDRHEQHASHPHRGNGHTLHVRQDAERFLQAYPISIGVKAVFEASLEQVEAWQMTMLKSFQPGKFFSLSDR